MVSVVWWGLLVFLGWFFGFWGWGFGFFEVFFEGFPVEFCPSFEEFVGLFCWHAGLDEGEFCAFWGWFEGEFEFAGWVVFWPVCGLPFLDYACGFFEFEVCSEDVFVPCCEFAADCGFSCGFAVCEFGVFFGVCVGFVDLFGCGWEGCFLFYDCEVGFHGFFLLFAGKVTILCWVFNCAVCRVVLEGGLHEDLGEDNQH